MDDALDAELDAILYHHYDELQLQHFDPSFPSVGPVPTPHGRQPLLPRAASASASSRFTELKPDSEIEQAKASSIPKNTKKNTDGL